MWRLMPVEARRALRGLAIISIVAALFELATFAALAALLGSLDRPEDALARNAGLFAMAALASGGLRLWLAARTASLTADVAHRLGVEAQQRLLDQPLAFHADFNSARALAMLDKVQLLTGGVLRPTIAMAQSLLIGGAILAAVIATTPATAIAVIAFLATAYLVIARLTSRRIADVQTFLENGFETRLQTVQESFAGIRDVILDQSQEQRVAAFAAVDGRLQRAMASVQALIAAPRLLVEGVGMALLGLLVLVLAERGAEEMLPAVGLVAFAALRLLPLASALYGGWQSWAANRTVIDDVSDILALPLRLPADTTPVPFREEIALERACFAYRGGPPILEQVSLHLPRGSRTGVAGATGAGKSTLGDLLMGLIEPTSGRLTIDGVPVTAAQANGWQRNVAHVGQQLFLLDASVAENIAFGDPSPDRFRIETALQAACLEELAARIDEPVGERGIRLSGGQRQRLGLARAFYKNAPFLVLDEATSALDAQTEARILAGLDPSVTLLVIGHRPATLAICERIFDLAEGRLTLRS